MIAIAISCDPQLLIADEPTTALDATIQAQILDLLRSLTSSAGMSVLLVTHNLGVVAGLADRIAVLYAGRVVELGSAEDVLLNPKHPYTTGLLQSISKIDEPRQPRLLAIPGSTPNMYEVITECPFRPRCLYAIEACAQEPTLRNVAAGHRIACWVDLPFGTAVRDGA